MPHSNHSFQPKSVAAHVALCLVLLAFAFPPNASASPEPGALAVKFDGEWSTLPLLSAFVLPSEELSLETWPPTTRIDTAVGKLTSLGGARWVWQAPSEPGTHTLIIRDETGHELELRVFVMHPYAGEEVFDGFRIGRYERIAKDGDPAYAMPRGLVRVTEENADLAVSPNFRLGQFLCKQEGEWPRYLVLRTSLLRKLEALQQVAEDRMGGPVNLHVMSGYRTPAYNRAIGNTTVYSRHLYGDAADVFVDVDGDSHMDDLTGDGRIDERDAGLLFGFAERVETDPRLAIPAGGLGVYGPKAHRGPFVHVDARGHEARWGDRRGGRWLANHRPQVADE